MSFYPGDTRAVPRADAFSISTSSAGAASFADNGPNSRTKNKSKDKDANTNKRRCVSTACIACRRRKSKCDGNLPKCAACASVYLTECEYAPHTDHRRKGVYKKDVDNLKTKNSTLQVLIHALLNAEEEEEAFEIVRQIRSTDNLEEIAQLIENRERGIMDTPDSPIYGNDHGDIPQFESELSGKMGDLVIDGSVKFIGGTSNLIWLNDPAEITSMTSPVVDGQISVKPKEGAILGWTTVTQDRDLILHFINMYFCWHYAYFTTLSKELFYRDFLTGTNSQYCSRLLVNVMLALGCHFSSKPTARSNPDDSATTGDHYFAEAKRLLHENDEFGTPKLCTVQALALMSVREAGCGRESTGWVYSGMSFRLASDLGLNVNAETMNDVHVFSDEDVDARRITFWGCFLFDKCWSNYLGRQPQLVLTNTTVKKPEVFGSEDSEMWSPYTDSGIIHAHTQPARTRAVSLQIFKLAEISSDLLNAFYQPQHADKQVSKQTELKKLTDIHTRLETWRRELPLELDAKDGQLPQVVLMHMFYQLLYIHLYRPFLKYTKATSPLPSHVSPRKFCTQAASAISKLFRLYKRTHGLRQICNIAVYIAHSACTIHLLNLPDKNAKRDIIHGIKQLEEIGDFWICARRTLRILSLCAEKWKIELPEETQAILERTNQKWVEELSQSALSPGVAQHLQSQPIYEPPTQNPPQQEQQTTQQHNHQQLQQRQHQHQQQTNYQHHLRQQPQQQQFQEHGQTQQDQQQQRVRHESIANINYGAAPESISSFEVLFGKQSNRSRNTSIIHEHDGVPNPTLPKVSLNLTQAQQDAWNAHQVKLGHLAPSGTKTPNEQSLNASVFFGGVDSLMEASQDWWYNDQSQIALGFDNWNTPSSTDWSLMSTPNLGMVMNSDSGAHVSSAQATPPYPGAASMHNGGGHNVLPTTSAPTGFPSTAPRPPQFQNLQPVYQYGKSVSASPPARNARRPSDPAFLSTAQKRTSSYDDTMMY